MMNYKLVIICFLKRSQEGEQLVYTTSKACSGGGIVIIVVEFLTPNKILTSKNAASRRVSHQHYGQLFPVQM